MRKSRGTRPRRRKVAALPTEWQIVEVLVRNPGKLVSPRQLLQEVWGPQYEHETNYLRVYLAQIRRKRNPILLGLAISSRSLESATASSERPLSRTSGGPITVAARPDR
jgi:hypothetical protein